MTLQPPRRGPPVARRSRRTRHASQTHSRWPRSGSLDELPNHVPQLAELFALWGRQRRGRPALSRSSSVAPTRGLASEACRQVPSAMNLVEGAATSAPTGRRIEGRAPPESTARSSAGHSGPEAKSARATLRRRAALRRPLQPRCRPNSRLCWGPSPSHGGARPARRPSRHRPGHLQRPEQYPRVAAIAPADDPPAVPSPFGTPSSSAPSYRQEVREGIGDSIQGSDPAQRSRPPVPVRTRDTGMLPRQIVHQREECAEGS
jgi:hypothetical protein